MRNRTSKQKRNTKTHCLSHQIQQVPHRCFSLERVVDQVFPLNLPFEVAPSPKVEVLAAKCIYISPADINSLGQNCFGASERNSPPLCDFYALQQVWGFGHRPWQPGLAPPRRLFEQCALSRAWSLPAHPVEVDRRRGCRLLEKNPIEQPTKAKFKTRITIEKLTRQSSTITK